MKLSFIFLVLFMLLFISTAHAEYSPWITITTSDGLADNAVKVIVEDSQGTLWVGTECGLNCYDGVIWTTFTEADGLAADWVNAIYEDSQGVLWFGTYGGGVSRYDGNGWTTYTTSDGLAGNNVRAICEDNQGAMWFGTENGASRYDDGAWETFLWEGTAVFTIYKDSQGILWFGTNRDVWRYKKNELHSFSIFYVWEDIPPKWINAIHEDYEGAIWFGTWDGVRCYDGNIITALTMNDGLASNIVTAIYEDNQGSMWFGTMDFGLSHYDNGSWTTFTTADGLAHNDITAILEDSQGSLWIGTRAGLNRYDFDTWTTFTTDDGLAHNSVGDIIEDSHGALWFATLGGVNRYYEGEWMCLTHTDGLASNTVIKILEDSQGSIWVGTENGLSRYDNENWITYTTADGLAHNYITAILEDSQGSIWVGTENGLSRYDNENWTTYTTADGLAHNYITAILKDSQNILWVTTKSDEYGFKCSISCFDGSKWTTLFRDGPVIYEIYEDSQKELWFGTNIGVYNYDRIEWTLFTTADGLSENNVETIIEDNQKILWFGTVGGVTRYDRHEWATFTIADGLANNYVWTICEDNQGVLWFGTYGGVSRYRGDKVSPNTKIILGPVGIIGVPSCLFTYKGGDNQTKASELLFSYAITENCFVPDENFWSSFSNQTYIDIKPLQNGTYTFHVRAKDKVGNIDATPAQRTFTVDITPPTVVISSPSNDAVICGKVEINGSVFDNSDIPDFNNYTLDYGKGTSEEKVSEWHPVKEGEKQSVINGLLGVWDTEDLYGTYVLKLRAVDSFDHRSKYAVTVHVVAAAEEIDRRDGGYVTDITNKINLYIPPNGIPENKQITITPVAIEEITIPPDQQLELVGNIYDIEPMELELIKTATLSVLQDNREEFPESRLAIFCWSDTDNLWEKIGGSFDEETGKITVAINRLGRFAVMNDLSAEMGELSITDVDCQPRAFSPKGGGYDTKTTITFTLGKSSNVTVKIYDPSGRLKKKLVEGERMNHGSNAVVWDGKDYDGSVVVSGLYIVTVEAGSKMAKKTVGVMNK